MIAAPGEESGPAPPERAVRVLLVTRADGVGGAERTMANLIVMLDRHGIGWDLVTLRGPRYGPGPLAVHAQTVIDFPARIPQMRRWRQLRWLRTAMRGGSYQAVIAFGPVANGLVALARGSTGPTTIVSEQGDPYIRERRSWNRWFMWTYRRADMAVVPTELLATELLRDRRRPPQVKVIANSLAPGAAIVPRGGPRDPVIASVSRLAPVKRVDDLIEAFALLGPGAEGWTVTVTGDGEERPRLEALTRARSLADRVRFVGVHPAPWELLARSEIFVLCSEREGFASVLIEAMASGCAVVASDCRFGPRELIADGVNGMLYPRGDVQRLAAVLEELISDPQRRDSLARAATERARAYTIDAIAPLWLEAIGMGGQT